MYSIYNVCVYTYIYYDGGLVILITLTTPSVSVLSGDNLSLLNKLTSQCFCEFLVL